MNINKSLYKNISVLFLALFVISTSCSLDEYNPTAVSEASELGDFDGWKSAQSSCYTGLFGALIGMQYGLTTELGTDLWTIPYGNTINNAYRQLIAYNELTTGYGLVNNIWYLGWGPIKDCNKAIELAPKLTDGIPADIKTLVAEAKFLRAFYYSVLVTQFGELPLILTADLANATLEPKRNSVAEVYAQIVADLKDAVADLAVTPFENNPSRVTKKSALGLLARVYAQGAGEGLTEDGKSYWVRAKEVADDLINNQAAYGATLYDDFGKVFASANNRNNAEALFVAYGRDPYDPSWANYFAAGNTNLYLHYYPKFNDAFGTADVFLRDVNANTSNAYYGRLNQQFVAPTKYLVDCFDARYDKRWENTFVTAFANYSGVQSIAAWGSRVPAPSNVTYDAATVTLTAAMCDKYELDASHAGKKIYPYVDVGTSESPYGSWQYFPKIWNQGTYSGDAAADLTEHPVSGNVHPYPLAVNEDRFFAYLSKEPLTAEEKNQRAYVVVNIEELFDFAADPTGSTYKTPNAANGLSTPGNSASNRFLLANLFPAMMKFNHNFDGAWVATNFQTKIGNKMVMRMAEVYLLAAEATLNSGGSGATAANYMNELRKRACRNVADFNTATGMQLTTATLDDVFDEYARELCGEFNRWALLKRNRAFENRLQRFNNAAFVNFKPIHYNRPIPLIFLNQINNAEEFGSNGY